MDSEKITVYGTTWCGDCHMATRLLDQQGVAYQLVDIDSDEQARRYVVEVNDGIRRVPTIVFQDGSILAEPSSVELAAKLRSHF